MTIQLENLKSSFQGVIPSAIVTSSKDGIPNIAYLSHVHLVDSRHVALTTQFFNKTAKNLSENARCLVRVIAAESFVSYQLQAKRVRTETAGPLFDIMAERLAAIADYSGASDFFALKAVEILEVLSIQKIEHESSDSSESTEEETRIRFSTESLQLACERFNASQTLDELFDSTLQAMDLDFGFRHSMILLADESMNRLLTIASRGYPENGVGSEVKFGEGIIGRAAENRLPFVNSSLSRALIYANQSKPQDKLAEAIPLPGLKNSQCQIAIPLVVRNELLGILFAESQKVFDFRGDDEQLLKTLASVLAMGIRSLQAVHRAGEEPAPPTAPAASVAPVASPAKSSEKLVFTYFAKEDCVFLNGEYLIRSVPARILWKLLQENGRTGKCEFTNRELRMDAFLQLPETKDNLETRLILLRKRLEKNCPAIKLVSCGRGRFTFQVSSEILLAKG